MSELIPTRRFQSLQVTVPGRNPVTNTFNLFAQRSQNRVVEAMCDGQKKYVELVETTINAELKVEQSHLELQDKVKEIAHREVMRSLEAEERRWDVEKKRHEAERARQSARRDTLHADQQEKEMGGETDEQLFQEFLKWRKHADRD